MWFGCRNGWFRLWQTRYFAQSVTSLSVSVDLLVQDGRTHLFECQRTPRSTSYHLFLRSNSPWQFIPLSCRTPYPSRTRTPIIRYLWHLEPECQIGGLWEEATHHLSVGTPKGSRAKPGSTGRPSCHVSVDPGWRGVGFCERPAGLDISPMTITSSFCSVALSKANAREEDDAPVVP